jgi:flagellin
MQTLTDVSHYHLNRAHRAHTRAVARVTSGRRGLMAADDPAGLQVADNLATLARSARVAQRDIADGQSLMLTLDAAGGEAANLVKRIRELAVQAASETLTDTSRAHIEVERSQLADEVDRIAHSTEAFGQVWTQGTTASITIQVGTKGSDTIDVQIGDLRAATLGIDGHDFSTTAGALAALPDLDAALDAISGQRATYGATANRLEFAHRLAAEQELQLSAASGRIVDADMAAEVAEMTRAQLSVQKSAATQVMVRHANQNMMRSLLG